MVLKTLYQLYIVNNVDIFNFLLSCYNKATYHYIIEVEVLLSLGFPITKTISNGTVLSSDAHNYLYLIEDYVLDIFSY